MLITWEQLWKTTSNFSGRKNLFKDNEFFKGFITPVSNGEKLPFDRKYFFGYLDYMCGTLTPFTDNPYEATFAVHNWSKTRVPHWQRILDILNAEYEPLWNYNRYDEANDKRNEDINQNITETDEDTENEDYTGNVKSVTEHTDDVTTDTAGFDSGNLVSDKFVDDVYNGTLDETDTYNRHNLINRNDINDLLRHEGENTDHWAHSYGNIGVMSSQDLIKQEIEIAMISLYNIIIDEFKEQFCLLIY